MSKSVKHVLVDARDLISKPKWFTKRNYAEDGSGESCSPKSPRACRWCAEGAIYASDGVEEVIERSHQRGPLETKFRSAHGFESVQVLERCAKAGEWGGADQTDGLMMLRFISANLTHKQVLRLFDEAIATVS